MNQEEDPAGDAARDAEWQRQERARDLERGAPDRADDSARVQRYRQVVRALDQRLGHALPSNFAHAGTREIEQRLARRRQQDRAFERRLRGGLLFAYLGCLVAAAAVYLHAWQPGLQGLMTPDRLLNPWLLSAVCCLTLSWPLIRRSRRSRRTRR